MSDTVERKACGNSELGSGKVDTGDHFCGRMFDPETGVELEEAEFILCVAVYIWGMHRSDQKEGCRPSEGSHSTVPALTYPTSVAKRTAESGCGKGLWRVPKIAEHEM